MAKGRTLTLKVEAEVGKLDKLDNFGQKLSKVGAALTLGVTLPLAAAGTAAFKFASDLNEATSKAATVFGDSVDTISEKATSLDDAFSESEFRDTAGTFGALLKNMGLTEQAAADLSVEWLGLAQDMASFHDTNVDDALGAIQSALSGEFEPLKRFGVRLSESAIQAEALEQGLVGSNGQIDNASRLLIISNELFSQQSDVVGDFERTADGAANKTRTLAANIQDAAAKIGNKLLPTGARLLEMVDNLVTSFANLDEGTQDFIVTAGLAAAALGPLLGVLGNLLRVGKSIPEAIPWLFAAAPIAGMVGLKIAADDVTAGLGDAGIEADEVSLVFGRLFDDITDGANDVSASFGPPTAALATFSDEVIASQDAWTDYQLVLSGAMDDAVTTVGAGTDTMAELLGDVPEEGADAMLANQFHIGDAITELNGFMEQALAPATEIFEAQGFLNSDTLANALGSPNPLIRTKAQEMQQQAIDALDTAWALNAGKTFSNSFASGLVDPIVLDYVKDSAYKVALAARGVFFSSEPKDPRSPLRGWGKVGGNMIREFADSMRTSIPDVRSAAFDVADAALGGPRDLPGIAGPRIDVSGPAGGALGAGPTVNLTVHGDLRASERTLPGTIVRGLYASGFTD